MRTQTIALALVAAPLLTGLGFALAPTAAEPAAAAPAAQSSDFGVDLSHSHIGFRTKHLGLSWARGRFDQFTGSFSMGDAPSISIDIDTSSVDSQNTKRDDHLKGPDFFNSGEFPKATFRSTKVTSAGEGRFSVTGDLEMLGKTKQLSFEAELVGEGPDPWEGYRAGLSAEFMIKRSDFGMTWGIENGAVGDEVFLRVDLEGVRK